MDYKTKIKYAEEVADQILKQKNRETIQSSLQAKGLYEQDIDKVILSAKKIVGEKYQPKIQEFLLHDKQILGSDEFALIDEHILKDLISKERQNLEFLEKKKITKLIKEGQSAADVYDLTDTRFLAEDKAVQHIARLKDIKNQNSGSGRVLNIVIGISLIIGTGIILVTMDRLFYVLPVIGVYFIIKGFTIEKLE